MYRARTAERLSRVAHVVGAVLVGVATAAAPAVGQAAGQGALLSADERARLEAEMDRLADRMDAVLDLEVRIEEERERQAERALRRIENGGLTETIGPLLIRRPGGTPPVEPRVRPILDAFRSTLGDLGDLEIAPIYLYLPEELGPLRPPSTRDSRSGDPVWYRYANADLNRIGDMVTSHIIASIPAPIGGWSAGYGWRDDHDTLAALRSMALTESPEGIACLQRGDIDACARFLFLEDDGSDDTRLRVWSLYYSQARIRTLEGLDGDIPLLRCIGRSRRIGVPVPRLDCLRQLSRTSRPAEFMADRMVRGSLVAYAVRRGGPGPTDRLEVLPAGVDVGDQLEAIAGMPIDELIAAWRADAMNGEGMFEDVGGDPPGPVSLLWAGGFALLALRSTRWRLG